MESEAYKVNVLHVQNPHLIWVELISSNKNRNEDIFEQIGLFGVLPLETQLNILTTDLRSSEAANWSPAATKIVVEEIEKAKSVKFQPIFIDDTNSIFNSKIHKFGELLIKKDDNEVVKLSEVLNASYFSFRNKKKFKDKLLNGSLNTVLNNIQKAEIIKILNDNIVNKTKINNGNPKVTEEEEDFFNDAQKSIELLKLTTENLNKHNRAFTEDENLLDASNNKIHKFFSTIEEDATNIAEQSSVISDGSNINRRVDKLLNKSLNSSEKDSPRDIPKHDRSLNEDDIKSTSNILNLTNKDYCPPYNKEYSFRNKTKNKDSVQKNRTSRLDTPKPQIYGPPEISKEAHLREVKKLKKEKKYISTQSPKKDYNEIIQEYETKSVTDMNQHEKKTMNEKFSSNLSTHSNSSDVSSNIEIYLKFRQKSLPKPTIEVSETQTYKVPQFVPKNKVTPEKSPPKNKVPVEMSKVDRLLNVMEHHKKIQESKKIQEATTAAVDPSQNCKYDSDNETTISSLKQRLNLEHNPTNNDIPDSHKKLENDPIVPISNEIIKVNAFNNIDLGISKFIDKVVSPVLIVHSKMNTRIQPSLELRDIYFQPYISLALHQLSVKKPKMLQTVSWPCILRGYSTFMISPIGSGKTFGYLPSICQLVADFKKDPAYLTGHGPLAIIVGATAKSVTFIEKQCRKMLGTKGIVNACFPGINEKGLGNSMVNGCDIFVSTPCALVRFLTMPLSPLSLKRLILCVIDDCERIEVAFLDEVRYFLLKIKEMLSKRIHKEHDVQYIVASRVWCPFMENLAKRAPNTIVSISAYQEAILYSKIKTYVSFVENSNKIKAAIQFINEIDDSKRTVIVCCTNEEVDTLKKAFRNLHYVVFAGDNNMNVETLYQLNQEWEDYDVPFIGPILICCDENLLHLNITNASYLLHYSLPDLYSTFCKRFAVLTDNYPSIFTPEDRGNNDVRIKIFIGEQNYEQLPKMVCFMKRCTNNIPPVINEISAKVLEEKEFNKAKLYIPICDKLLSFGYCADFWNCKERHSIFKQFDLPPEWVPTTGYISFVITEYLNAVTYAARLLTHTFQGKTIKYDQNFIPLSLEMDMYYMNDNHKIPHGIPKIGDVCAVSTSASHFTRCQVVKIMSTYDNGTPHEVVIKLIDEEKWERSKDIYLYYLPDKFKEIKTYVVQIKLGGLQPRDRDLMFSDLSRRQLKSLIEKNENIFMRGNIITSVGNVIIIDSVEACQKLTTSNEVVVRHNFKEELLKQNAILNDNYYDKLKELFNKSDIEFITQTDDRVVEKIPLSILPRPSWAHFDADEMSLIYFAYAESADKFYVRLEKFQDCLEILTDDIQTYLKNPSEPKASINVGDLILAKFPDDNKFYRGRIDEIFEDNRIRCFFVDHGDWRFIKSKDVFDITEKFITQLPFQAIECRLVGVQPFGENWTEFCTNWLCDIGFEGNTNNLKDLYVKYFLKEKAESTGGHKYAVVVIDTSGDTDVLVNNLMIDANLARPLETELHFLKQIENTLFKKEQKENLSIDENISVIEETSYTENNISIEHFDSDKTEENLEKAWEKEAEPYLNRNIVRKVEDIIAVNNTLANIAPEKPIRTVPLVDDDYLSDEWDIQIDSDDPRNIPAAFGFDVRSPKQTSVSPTSPTGFVKFPAIEAPLSVMTNSTSSSIQIIPSPANDVQPLDSDDSLDPEELVTSILSQESTRKPKIYWNQTNEIVNIKFEVLDIKTYNIKIKADRVLFSAIINNINYAFGLDLYGVVKINECTHSLKGHRLYIKLVKLVKIKWMRLSKDAESSWIKYDPDCLDSDSDNEDSDLEYNKETVKKIVERSLNEESESDDSDVYFQDDFARTYGGYD